MTSATSASPARRSSAASTSAYITVNKNAIPNDPEKPFVTSGIRVGTPAATTRGLKEEDMKEIARIMGMVARDFEGNKTAAQEAVVALTKKYPIYE